MVFQRSINEMDNFLHAKVLCSKFTLNIPNIQDI